MDKKDSRLKYFNNSSFDEKARKSVYYYLKDSGMKEKEIYKILKEYGLIDDRDEININDDSYKGKGKK